MNYQRLYDKYKTRYLGGSHTPLTNTVLSLSTQLHDYDKINNLRSNLKGLQSDIGDNTEFNEEFQELKGGIEELTNEDRISRLLKILTKLDGDRKKLVDILHTPIFHQHLMDRLPEKGRIISLLEERGITVRRYPTIEGSITEFAEQKLSKREQTLLLDTRQSTDHMTTIHGGANIVYGIIWIIFVHLILFLLKADESIQGPERDNYYPERDDNDSPGDVGAESLEDIGDALFFF